MTVAPDFPTQYLLTNEGFRGRYGARTSFEIPLGLSAAVKEMITRGMVAGIIKRESPLEVSTWIGGKGNGIFERVLMSGVPLTSLPDLTMQGPSFYFLHILKSGRLETSCANTFPVKENSDGKLILNNVQPDGTFTTTAFPSDIIVLPPQEN